MTAKYITTFDENNVYNSYEFYYNIRMSGKTNIQIQLNLWMPTLLVTAD